MGARSQLNGAHLTGIFLIATTVAVVSGSSLFGVFVFDALTLIGPIAGDNSLMFTERSHVEPACFFSTPRSTYRRR